LDGFIGMEDAQIFRPGVPNCKKLHIQMTLAFIGGARFTLAGTRPTNPSSAVLRWHACNPDLGFGVSLAYS